MTHLRHANRPHQTRFVLLLLLLLLAAPLSRAQESTLTGSVSDPTGNLLPHATVQLLREQSVMGETISGPDGHFALHVASPGSYSVKVIAPGFRPVLRRATLAAGANASLDLRLAQLSANVTDLTITADVNDLDVLSPDPGEKVFVRQDLLDANPGRPGAPVSIPGYPIETASSGIKAPQYFAPGVAGDHGEPIAQYLAIGSYLVTNNLSANAHGNGYADPNILIPQALESVQVDGGAFNVLQGNHAVNLAAVYGLRSSLDPFLSLTVDPRDADVVAGFSPSPQSFMALEASLGNGFLDRLEHRRQYKLNTQRIVQRGNHHLTFLGLAYFGSSAVPGLAPLVTTPEEAQTFPNYGDSIDLRQKDQTHTALFAANDTWKLTPTQQLLLSGLFRTYNLTLYSDFGAGLIRQSEFRTVTGATADYLKQLSPNLSPDRRGDLSLLAGLDYLRDAPRRDNLDHYGLPNPAVPYAYGPFTPVSSNDVTITSTSPYAAVSGTLVRFLHVYAGWRRDEIQLNNVNRLAPTDSSRQIVGLNSPKATVSFLAPAGSPLPTLSLSFGQAFFTEDPRTGTGSAVGSAVATAHSYQLVASKSVASTDFKLTLGHITTSSELAKIDPDTGLQQDQGPARNQFLTVAVRHRFRSASLLATFSKADARDLDSGQPTPEAPRTLVDLLAGLEKLPLGLQARGEFEYVGLKPLGTGCVANPAAQCTGTPVREIRAAVVRPFLEGRFAVGVNLLFASGYSGQTLETLLPSPALQVVGVRIPSYASLNLTYHFGRGQTSAQETDPL